MPETPTSVVKTEQFDRIMQVGTNGHYRDYRSRAEANRPSNKIVCADGFHLSVIAGYGTYCTPRPDYLADERYEGPYVAAEVGYPSKRPEPWADWEPFAEDDGNPTETVYGFVPAEIIRALIVSHGGEK